MASSHPPNINGTSVPYGATVEELGQCLTEPGPAAWAAFTALGGTPEKDALRLLISHASSADWRYRRLAVEAISSHALAAEATDVFVDALSDPNLYVVITGCNAVACHRLSRAHTRLVTLLSRTEPQVREAAVAAIAQLWQTEDYDMVKRLLESDVSPKVRKKAALALMCNANQSTWRDLYNLWQMSANGHYRLWAVELMRQFGSEEDTRLLGGFRDDPDGHVRKAAALPRLV